MPPILLGIKKINATVTFKKIFFYLISMYVTDQSYHVQFNCLTTFPEFVFSIKENISNTMPHHLEF